MPNQRTGTKTSYVTDTIKFAQEWHAWLVSQEELGNDDEWLATQEAEDQFIAHMRTVFDGQNKAYTKDRDAAIKNKANYVNTALKERDFDTLFLPGTGKPQKRATLEDAFLDAGFAKTSKSKK